MIEHLVPASSTADTADDYLVDAIGSGAHAFIVCGLVADDEPDREQWMKLMETSGAFDFWHDPEEDIYSPQDGLPIR